ncbi:MAG: pseudouridine synthase [Myxococcota bacterium]
MEEGKQRLAKVLAARGVASRREAERIIGEGHVTVAGEVVTDPAFPVDVDTKEIRIDGKPISRAPRLLYVLLYKPKGFITSRNDPEGRKSVLTLLPNLGERVEPVGRLDINTEGALLLTNDGALAHKLAHPAGTVPKRYLAKVWKTPSDRTIERLEKGVMLEDGKTAPAKVRVVKTTDTGNCWLEITVTEGRNRLVRRMLAEVGHPVSKLTRVSFATISIRGMERGEVRALTAEEVARLRDLAEGIAPSAAGRKARPRKTGFAKADPEWIAKRVDKKARKDKRGSPPRGGAAR